MRLFFVILFWECLLGFNVAECADELSIELHAEQTLPAGIPITVEGPLDENAYWVLQEVGKDQRIQLQRDGASGVGLLDRKMERGERRQFKLLSVIYKKPPTAQVKCVEQEGRLVVSNRGQDVLHYRAKTVEPPEGQSKLYRRSGYLHPVYSPSGKVITGDFSPDHAHQHGVMFAWTNTEFQGRKVDFWNQLSNLGRIEHREIISTISGPVFAEFVVSIAHVDLTSGKPIDVLSEKWRLRVYDRGEGDITDASRFMIDFESAQIAVSDEPLKVKKHHYGGFAIRTNAAWLGKDPKLFQTSEGKNRKNGNQSQPQWCAVKGELEGSSVGVVLAAHQENFRHPVPVRLHPHHPYFCWAPLALGDFDISREKPLKSRYRLWTFEGELNETLAHQLTENYSNPTVLLVPQ